MLKLFRSQERLAARRSTEKMLKKFSRILTRIGKNHRSNITLRTPLLRINFTQNIIPSIVTIKTSLKTILILCYNLSQLISTLFGKVKAMLEKQTSKRLQLLRSTRINITINVRRHSLAVNLLLFYRLRPQRMNLLLLLRSIRRTLHLIQSNFLSCLFFSLLFFKLLSLHQNISKSPQRHSKQPHPHSKDSKTEFTTTCSDLRLTGTIPSTITP